jgi:retron-type reverse transcriptase
MKLTLKRFYLDKGMERDGIPNNKFRPIGAPTLISRVISKAFTDMTYFVHESDMKPFQHGYRLDKGCYSALFEV